MSVRDPPEGRTIRRARQKTALIHRASAVPLPPEGEGKIFREEETMP